MLELFSLLLALAVATVSGDIPGHKLVLKTFQQAQFECKQYLRSPADSVGICEPRCIEIVLRSWTDCHSLLTIPFGRHFQPDSVDTEYANRTKNCLLVALAGASNDNLCCRASLAWQCYRDQYGNAIGTPQLAPTPDTLVAGAIQDCARMLEIDYLEFRNGATFRFDISPRTRSLMRCVLIRLGLYNDVTGPDLDRMYVQCGGYQIDEFTFKEDARKCVDSLVSQCLDNSTLATRIASQCFPMGIGPLDIITTIGHALFSLLRPSLDSVFSNLQKKLAPGLFGEIFEQVLFTVVQNTGFTKEQYLQLFGLNPDDTVAAFKTLDPATKAAILRELDEIKAGATGIDFKDIEMS